MECPQNVLLMPIKNGDELFKKVTKGAQINDFGATLVYACKHSATFVDKLRPEDGQLK